MKAVLFDMDGTLVNTPDGIVDIAREMFPDADEAEVRSSIGLPLPRVMARLCHAPEDSPEVEAACATFRKLFTTHVVSHARDLVFPGVHNMLEELRSVGVLTAIVTSKSTAGAEEMLQAADLRDKVDVVIGYEPHRPGKPEPDQALEATASLGLLPAECVVVGDSVDDVKMARAAGMRAVGVSYGVSSLTDLMSAGVDTIVTIPTALEGLLVSLIPPAARQQLSLEAQHRSAAIAAASDVIEQASDALALNGPATTHTPVHDTKKVPA